jgi:ubiquinone/menaquinone biosynthesis C-methylase UbiE
MKGHSRLFAAVFGLVILFGFGLSYASAQLDQLPAQQYVDLMGSAKRLPTLKVDEVIAKLGLKPGDIVADVGSGSGAYSIAFAKAVAPNGIVYAVDIDQEMLNYVADQAKKAGVTNLRTVLGEYNDPKLPVRNIDVAFFQQVLHMIINRQTYLDTVVNYLKPDGRVVVIDKNPDQNMKSWMWLKQSDVDTWMQAISFYPAQQFNLFDDRYFAVYRRPEGASVPMLNKHTPTGAPLDSGN